MEEGVVDAEEVVVMAVLVVWLFPNPTQIDRYDQSNRIDFLFNVIFFEM
jgi:hypothetical protein